MGGRGGGREGRRAGGAEGGLPSQPVQQNRVARDTNFDSAIGVCEQFGSIGRWLFIRVFSVDFAESAAWRFRVCALTDGRHIKWRMQVRVRLLLW